MSVINKMLRDLDQRQAAQAPPSTDAESAAKTPLRQGTSSVAKAAAINGTLPRHGVWMGLLGVVIAAMAGVWLWMQPGQDVLQGDRVAAKEPAAVTTVALAAPSAASEPAPVSEAAVQPVLAAMELRMEESLSARRALDALLSTPVPMAPSTASAPVVATASSVVTELNKARVVAVAPVVAAVPAVAMAKVPVAPVQADAMPVVQRQQQAGTDALAHAQSLWNTGAHDAAIELMQQSIAVAERSTKAGAGGIANPVLIPLVREMARMQLAEGRFGAVWEMLTRLEPQLANQPDLWAIRANAAQRLGRHQDSVHAYMAALQSRPDEQRWLLGTAVSLVALGQISSASEMAEKARAVGPVAKDIAAYLRQSGVNLRD